MLFSPIVLFLIAFQASSEYLDYYKVSEHLNALDQEQACDSEIFCRGRLLEAVMSFKLFNDSKTFVDMPLKFKPEEVSSKFKQQFPSDGHITEEKLHRFVQENFRNEGTELVGLVKSFL
jgi:hypothetical protein